MELCRTDTERLIKLLKRAALIIDEKCTNIRSLDTARQLQQMAKKIEKKK